jgi:hypothetical protein
LPAQQPERQARIISAHHQLFRSNSAGAIRDARHAGSQLADAPTATRTPAATARVNASCGSSLPLSFADERLPRRSRDVERLFRRRGAYSRFKDLPDREGLLDQWDAYETAATERALRAWCEEHRPSARDE